MLRIEEVLKCTESSQIEQKQLRVCCSNNQDWHNWPNKDPNDAPLSLQQEGFNKGFVLALQAQEGEKVWKSQAIINQGQQRVLFLPGPDCSGQIRRTPRQPSRCQRRFICGFFSQGQLQEEGVYEATKRPVLPAMQILEKFPQKKNSKITKF